DPGFSSQLPRAPPKDCLVQCIYFHTSNARHPRRKRGLQPALLAFSNSFTCCLAASVTREPLIIRATSSTRASPVLWLTRLTDLPSCRSFSIRYFCPVNAAI